MKQFLILFAFISTVSLQAQDFITEWTITNATNAIIFNALTEGGAVNYTWSASPSGNNGTGSFTQSTPGLVFLGDLNMAAGDVVTLSMTPKNLRRFYIDNGPHRDRLTNLVQWGSVPWSSMIRAFYGCSNLQISAVDLPNLTGVFSMYEMFRNCSSLNGPTNINNWNTSTITNMSEAFKNATSFNQNLGNWTLNANVNMFNMLNDSGMDCDHYSATLVGWAANNPTVTNRNFGASGISYGTSAVNARDILKNERGWTISFDMPSGDACDLLLSTGNVDFGNQVIVYPNPSSQEFKLKFNKAYQQIDVEVYNVKGQKVFNQNYGNTDFIALDFHEDSGVYFLKVNSDNQLSTFKIVRN
ncbi:MAG: BspA family leucine-rich repeat surface protein [Flavobacteriaceae bacterium]